LEHFSFEGHSVIRRLTLGSRVWQTSLENRSDKTLTAASAWWQSYLRGASVSSGSTSGLLRPIRTVDAFCGCGGLTLGAAQAALAVGRSLESVAAIDVDEEGLSVHRANFSTKQLFAGNASSLVDFHVRDSGAKSRFAYVPEIIDTSLAGEVGKIDLLLAGPPCQGHSNLNNRTRREDPRNLLYVTAVALAVGLGAKSIVIENVPEVISDKGDVVGTSKALLKAAGYVYLDSAVLAADALGGAQRRKRYFLIASKVGLDGSDITLESISAGLRHEARSLSWAIGDLLEVVGSGGRKGVMDTVPTLSQENQRRIDYLFENDEYDLPDAVRPDSHKNGHTYPSVYGRMHWEKPAQTITTGFLTPGRGRHIHPLHRRVITPREAARIQFFPDSFRFVVGSEDPSRAALTKWIGDAVPPLLGYAASLPVIARL
jgi:DNA (cytosine-5)-methyltransferase 1